MLNVFPINTLYMYVAILLLPPPGRSFTKLWCGSRNVSFRCLVSMSENKRRLLGLGRGVHSTCVILVHTYKAIIKMHVILHFVSLAKSKKHRISL